MRQLFLKKICMVSQREQQQQETHFRVMRLLDEDPSISTRKIAERVGISNGAAYTVSPLSLKGFCEAEKLHSLQKQGQLYLRTHPARYSCQGGADGLLRSARGMSTKTKLEIERLESELGFDEKSKSSKTGDIV